MQKISVLLTWLLACLQALQAQPCPQLNAAEIKLQLKKLNTLGSVLYVAAHPDDENTRLIAYFSKEKLYRTGYLSITRGDGGQNLIGNEQAELLGLIRTQELLAARRIDGGEQFFTRANDFGFSKSPDEALRIWGKDQILADVVWTIRRFRPDIIICRFPADGRGGHGHHTASAILAAEAFEAAADSTRFPEQLKYVHPWQAKRLMWNTFNFGGNNTTSPDQFKIDIGAYNPLLGKGYGELAAESRSQHKSQGFGVPAQRGQALEYFETIKGDPPQEEMMQGINTTWSRVEGGNKVAVLLRNALSEFNDEHPSAVLPRLLAIRRAIQEVQDEYWKLLKTKEVDQLILACGALWIEADAESPTVVPGQVTKVLLQLINRSHVPVTLQQCSVANFDTTVQQVLPFNQLVNISRSFTLSAGLPFTQPYWLQEAHPLGAYVIKDQQMVGRPENPPALTATFILQISDQTITVTRPVIYKFTDPVKGEVYRPLAVTPPVVANIVDPVYVFTSVKAQTIPVKLHAMKDSASGEVTLQLPANFQATPSHLAFHLQKKGDEEELFFSIHPVNINETAGAGDSLRVEVSIGGQTYSMGIRTIAYDHIPAITLFPPAGTKLVTLALKVNGLKVGYIPGAGDLVAEALKQVGYAVTILDEQQIMHGNLQQYDAIITGVRAYNVQQRLKYWQPRLLEYVHNGGILVVQYNNNFDLVTDQLGPYPFVLTRNRVTDEHAAVHFLNEKAAVLNFPNQITSSDFENWVQERGLYFVDGADDHYEKLFSMHDPKETDQDGATIVASYGKGKYVYTSLSFFRQLPAGVPGAYRLFVNLISKNK